MADLRAAGDPGHSVSQQRVFGDLIPYRNDEKGRTVIGTRSREFERVFWNVYGYTRRQLTHFGMSEHSATIVIAAGPAGPAWPLTPPAARSQAPEPAPNRAGRGPVIRGGR